MTGLFGQKWTSAYGLADRNGEWLKTLNGLHPAQLEIGLNRVRLAGSEWPPAAPEFRKLCLPKPEELGLPALAKAWQEANDGAGSPNHHPWSHRAVYLAGRVAGWHELRTAGTPQECRDVKVKFANAYQALTTRVLNGEPLEDQLAIEHQFDPAIHSNQRVRESMAEQGIDPLDGQSARARLRGMFG
ncbi:replication protein P [Endozoicomonas ascidiicola]|uniref:replication protein P n=1 Tax=Endozoicomonas ascidiicola TaxID=1698521 RepID=UPI000B188251|nr:replication protein P [Endozoicomonas ascidiicola]